MMDKIGANTSTFGNHGPNPSVALCQNQKSMDIDALTQRIIGCAYAVHNTLGPGYLEKVYENAMRIELESAGLGVRQQHPIPVRYRGQVVGDYFADMLIDECVLIELKAVQHFAREHEVQLVNYLTATGINDGLLINFGASVEVKRKFREFKSRRRDAQVGE
jgi:GxxExxY protein